MTCDRPSRKTDVQPVRTRKSIKDALLSLLEERQINDIHVTDICKRGGINRTTFYTHFNNISDALNEAIDDFLYDDELSFRIQKCSITCDMEYSCPYGICDRIRVDPRFARIAFNDSIRPLIIDSIMTKCGPKYVHNLTEHYDMSIEEAEFITHFQLNGCISINKRINDLGYDDGQHINRVIASFIQGGLTHFKRN